MRRVAQTCFVLALALFVLSLVLLNRGTAHPLVGFWVGLSLVFAGFFFRLRAERRATTATPK